MAPGLFLRDGALLAVLLAPISACGPSEPPPPDPTSAGQAKLAAAPTLELEFSGCHHVLLPVDDPTCVLDTAADARPELTLWVRTTGEESIEVLDGERRFVEADAVAVQQGFRFVLEDPGADRLTVRAGSDERTLRIARRSIPKLGGLAEAALRTELETASDEDRGDILRALARHARGTGSSEQALELYRAAAEAYEAAGQRHPALAAHTGTHHVLSFLDDPEAAGQVLEGLPMVPRGDGFSRFLALFNRGAWANRNGRFRTALSLLEDSIRQSERLALGQRWFSEQERVHLLARLGRYGEARQATDWLEGPSSGVPNVPFYRAKLYSNTGWARLLMAEAGRPVDASQALERALEESRAARDSELISNAELNLALAHLQAGRPQQARRHFESTKAETPEPPWWIEVWSLDIEARLALAEGRARQALELFARLGEAPELRSYPDAPWRSAIGSARALEALGRTSEALDAYARAEQELWRTSLSVPLDGGRHSSVHAYRRGTLLHLELLLRLERPGEVLDLVRRSRAHFFHGLEIDSRLEHLDPDEKAAWSGLIGDYRRLQEQTLAIRHEAEAAAADRTRALLEQIESSEAELDALRDEAQRLLDAEGLAAPTLGTPPNDELWLLYHPLEKGWLGLAVDARGIDSTRLALPQLPRGLPGNDEALSESLLAPFAEAIRRAQRIRILPFGELWSVRFGALPFDGAPLIERAPLVYGLDLPPREELPADRRALLIADPTGSLPHAPRELKAVRQALASAEPAWQIVADPHPTKGANAVRTALDRLSEVSGLFHFAGHGDLFASSGESGLVFERGFEGSVRLTLRDVLTLRRAPATVVLSACESLRRSPLGGRSSGLGLGHAFLLAGSESVVGAVEKVEDALAEEVIRAFYRHWQGPGTEAEALRRARLELRSRGLEGGSAFRVLER